MVKCTKTIVALALFSVSTTLGQRPTSSENEKNKLVLWYNKPAENWNEALPLGNGKLGVMVYGGLIEERFQLNEETIWTGRPRSYAHAGAYQYLDAIWKILQEMRKAEREGANIKKIKELQLKAETLAGREFMSIPLHQASYQPMADLTIDFPGRTQVEKYRRELDLTTGLNTVCYDYQGARYTREAFASYPDNCIVTRISAGICIFTQSYHLKDCCY